MLSHRCSPVAEGSIPCRPELPQCFIHHQLNCWHGGNRRAWAVLGINMQNNSGETGFGTFSHKHTWLCKPFHPGVFRVWCTVTARACDWYEGINTGFLLPWYNYYLYAGVVHVIFCAGHTLGTSLFSPPPSTTSPHGLFVNSSSSSGKMAFSPVFPAVGSGMLPDESIYISWFRFIIYIFGDFVGPVQQNAMSESPMAQQKQVFGKDTSNGAGGGNFQLPPRLAHHRPSGNRSAGWLVTVHVTTHISGL